MIKKKNIVLFWSFYSHKTNIKYINAIPMKDTFFGPKHCLTDIW